jgi:hypothetical protein
MQMEHVRRFVESERKRIKLWTPMAFVGRLRQFGGSQLTLRGDRLFMSGQCYNNVVLLATKKGTKQWFREWSPASWSFSEALELDEANGDLAMQRDVAVRERAARASQA